MSGLPQQIAVGQVWRSRDRRDDGQCVTVLEVNGDGKYDNSFVWVMRLRRSRMRYATLQARYELVQP